MATDLVIAMSTAKAVFRMSEQTAPAEFLVA